VAPTHYSIDIPADATELTIDVHRATTAGRYTMFLRDGQANHFIGVRLVHDAEIPIDGLVVLGRGDPHPLPRCQTLYIALRADDLNEPTGGESVYSIRATLERSGDPDATCPDPVIVDGGASADAGADAGDPGELDAGPTPGRLGGGGCECRAARGPGPSPSDALVAAGVFVLLLSRRRARRHR
jgi:MYXO-CTERM domain-containing protein